ncbi:hypothetical protein [Thiolapillus sp.]
MSRSSRCPHRMLQVLFLVALFSVLTMGEAAATAEIDTQTAEAATTPIVLKDDRFRLDCAVAAVQMGADGSLILEDSTCSAMVTPGATGSLKFAAGGETTHSCSFGGMTMNAQGQMTIRAAGSCFADTDQDEIPDYLDPLSTEKATAECLVQGQAPDESVSLSAANYSADATCILPAPNRLVAANTVVGAVNAAAVVEFHATDGIDVVGATVDGNSSFILGGEDQPTVRIWGPFFVKAGSIFAVHPVSAP